jgi:hypothetical protein
VSSIRPNPGPVQVAVRRRRRGAEAVPAPPLLHRELAEKLEKLPRDVAVAVLSLGVVGVVIPGPVPLGASFVLLGGVLLWPGVLARMGGPLARRCPFVFHVLIDFADHLRADLDRRYPNSKNTKCPKGIGPDGRTY